MVDFDKTSEKIFKIFNELFGTKDLTNLYCHPFSKGTQLIKSKFF